MFLIIVVQHWQGALAVLAEGYSLAVFLQHDGIVIGSDVHKADLKQFALGDGGAGLPLHQQLGVFACFQDVKPCAHHLQTAELVLFLAANGEFGGFVKHQLAGHLAVLHLQVFYIAYHVAALVHVQQHRVALVLLHVHACRQHPCAVAVQAVVGYSYSFSFTHVVAVFGAAPPGLRLQYYEVNVCPPKKCAMVAHFYESIAHFFGEPPKSWHFCK